MAGGAWSVDLCSVRRLVDHQAVTVALDSEPDRDMDVIECVLDRVEGPVATLRVTRSKSCGLKRMTYGALGFLTFDHRGAPVALRGVARAVPEDATVEFVVVDGVGLVNSQSSAAPGTGSLRAESSLERFFGYLAARDRGGAIAYATRLLDDGLSAGELILDVLVPAQASVGLHWERNEWSVEMEHVATEITEAVLAVVGARAHALANRGRLVVVCAETERHALPARMISELLRFEGFIVAFLGSATRPDSLTGFLSTFTPDALVVSCSIAMNLPSVVSILTAATEAGVPALCGGHAFGNDESRARALGASGWAPDLDSAVEIIDRWGAQPPRRVSQRAAGAAAAGSLELAHRSLVERCVAAHTDDLTPQTRASAQWWRREFDAILRFLTAAVLLDDDSILTEFTAWLHQRSRVEPQAYSDIGSLFATMSDVLASRCPAESALLRAQIDATADLVR